jgi:hypothetical protein
MPYYVMCRVSDSATGTRESFLTRHGVPVVFGTIADAEATAEDLQEDHRPRESDGRAESHPPALADELLQESRDLKASAKRDGPAAKAPKSAKKR